MASCTQIGNILQAYLDGEVSHSDKVILEEHVAQCVGCRMLLRKHQGMAAELFESFSDYRLRRALRGSILENLPEMEGSRAEHRQVDLAGLNWRAKHPSSPWGKIARRVPVAAVFVLLVLAIVLRYNWPRTVAQPEHIGVVTQASGGVLQTPRNEIDRLPAELRDFIEPGQRYETGSGATLMLSLLGPTQVKLKENTRIKLSDARQLNVEVGEVWVDVGNDGRLFKVYTPSSGEITVFGTAFGVKVDDAHNTTVAVQRGEVQVENDRSFVLVRPGYQVHVAPGRVPSTPEEANVDTAVAWADSIVEDQAARELFQTEVLARSEVTELRGNFTFIIDTTKGGRDWAVSAVILRWTPDERTSGYASYDMYVYDTDMDPLFKDRIPGRIFTDKTKRSCKIPVPSGLIDGAKVLIIRLVPVHEKGSAEIAFESVSAVAS